jgi:hypothetical protein
MSRFTDEIDYDAPATLAPIAPPAPPAPPATPPAPPSAPSAPAKPSALASLLAQGCDLLDAATTEAALDEAARKVAALCEAALISKEHATRVSLRERYRARKAAIQRTAWLALFAALWVRIWGSLRDAIEERPALVVRPIVAPTQRQAIPVVRPEASGLPLEQTLTSMAAPVTGTSSGSLRDGTMRGVGFNSAAGYVTALANGVKQATAAQYVGTLRGTYGYNDAQIAALTVTIIPETSVSSGALLADGGPAKVTHDGPDIFKQRRIARAEAAKHVKATADATTLALAQRLIVDDSPDAWWEIGWTGHGAGNITRGELVAATGSDELAPAAKVNSTNLSRTMDSLRGSHFDCDMVTTRPQGVKVRWQIGRGKQHAAFVGAEYGRVLAIVDLNSDGSLTFDGDATIADEVRDEYHRLCGDEVLRPGDVTAWLSQVLRRNYCAVRSGDRYLVSPKHKAAARELCSKLAAVWSVGGWVRGRLVDGVPELGVTYQDVATVIGGIWQGVAAEVTEAEERWAKTVTDAGAKPVGARACATELTRIDGEKPGEGLVNRINTMGMIGEGPLKALRDRVAALRAAVVEAQSKVNDTDARFAALELT